MSPFSSSNDVGSRVDAYCTTGSSPGRAGRTRTTLATDLGGSVEVEIPWEEHGPPHGHAVVVIGGISAGRHLLPTAVDPSPGWWPHVVGAGRSLDPARLRLLGVEHLGLLALDSAVTSADQARAVAAVLDDVGVPEVTLVGASYGGMVALAFAALFPQRTRKVVTFCAAHRSHPMATAWRSIQRRVVRLGGAVDRADEALALARGLAMTTYRSAGEFDARFDTAPVVVDGSPRFSVEAYLEARGAAFVSQLSPGRFLRLSESIDLHRVDAGLVRCPTTVVSFDTDTLVPPWLVEELAGEVAGPCTHVRISSVYGHDAFLKEHHRVAEVLRRVVGRGTDR